MNKKQVADLVDRFIEGLLNDELRLGEGERIVEQLQESSALAVPYAAEKLTSPDDDTRGAVFVLLREIGDKRAARPLRRMLSQPEYGDREKLRVIQTLDALGAPVDRATFLRAISDPDTLIRGSLEEMLETIDDPDVVAGFLDMMTDSPPEMLTLYLSEVLTPLADRRLLLLLTALLYDESDETILVAIDALERLKEPATIPLLEERAQYDSSPQVRHAAESAALRLLARVGPPDDRELTWPWAVPPPFPLAYCMLCTMDGNGGQVLLVSRRQPDGKLATFDLMFNDHEGIKDCFNVVLDEIELEEMMDTFSGVEFVDVRLERARDVLAAAYQTTLEAGRRFPPTLLAYRGWLKGEDNREVDESPLPSLDPARREELLSECADLLDLDEFDFWFFNPDEVADFMPRYRELMRERKAVRGKSAYEKLIDQAIESLVDEKYRGLLASRLRRQAWLLAQIYEDLDISLWALVAADALQDNVTVTHPLLRELMDYSFDNAWEGEL